MPRRPIASLTRNTSVDASGRLDTVEPELIACRRCGTVFTVDGGDATVPEHRKSDYPGLDCGGSGDSGFYLGLWRWYFYSGNALIFIGDETTEELAILPHGCSRERTNIKVPPDDAFNRHLHVSTPCLACRCLVTLQDYEEGPDGLLRARSG